MIRTSRRSMIAGALAVPTLAGLATWRWRHGEARVLLQDPALDAGRRFADAAGGAARPIEGDRVRLMRDVLANRPALIAGVSRHADMLLIADVAREAGYGLVATLHARGGRCTGSDCRPGWGALARLGNAAGEGWAEALAQFALHPGKALRASGHAPAARAGGATIFGWVLAPLR